MLYAAQLNSKALKRATPYISDKVPKGRLTQQAEIALSSFKAGVLCLGKSQYWPVRQSCQ